MDNEIFENLADLFVNDASLCDLHLGTHLRCDELDFSVQSLHVVDDYLDAVRENPGDQKQTLVTVLRAGSYAGEVVRRAAGRSINWLTYENAAPRSDVVKKFGKQPSTLGVLQYGVETVSFPFGKILKFLHFGRDESLHQFAARAAVASVY